MRIRLALLTGLGVGYVLGARAGRESYEKIKSQANKALHDPTVQENVKAAGETIRHKAPLVAEKTKEVASTAVEKTKEKVEEIKETRIETKAEKAADQAVEQAPADVISDPVTAPEDEGPLATA
ncbi:hypothetical protein ACN082_03190 [Rothia sp. CCM 9417]|uniref:hypothetical protein n=1 Tax=Rothia sp. CCM 9417 TaxID=3402657 RepID=UPI003AE84B15